MAPGGLGGRRGCPVAGWGALCCRGARLEAPPGPPGLLRAGSCRHNKGTCWKRGRDAAGRRFLALGWGTLSFSHLIFFLPAPGGCPAPPEPVCLLCAERHRHGRTPMSACGAGEAGGPSLLYSFTPSPRRGDWGGSMRGAEVASGRYPCTCVFSPLKQSCRARLDGA